MEMKEFNLEEYLKNPSRKVVTRNGGKVRIICTDRVGSAYPVVALITDDNIGLEILVTYTKDGIPVEYNEAYYTLFFEPERKERWVNVYRSESGEYSLGAICISKEHAEAMVGRECVATVKIEWEE